MILIVGGAFQGKTDFARSMGIKEFCGGESACLDDLWSNTCIKDYQLIVKRQLDSGLDPIAEAEELLRRNADIVIISTDIGCGIVPIDKSERQWREAVGRVCCYFAKKSKKVVRVICGIPTVIKESGDEV